MPLWWCSQLYQSKKGPQWARLCSAEPKRSGKVWPVLERLELRLGERVVIRDVRPRVALRDAEVRVQMRDHFRGPRRPAVRVDGQLTRRDSLALAGFFDELRRKRRALPVGDHPADNVAAEDVEEDVQVEVRPLRWAEQLRMSHLHTWFGGVASSSGFLYAGCRS
jgi:hypothetical protein